MAGELAYAEGDVFAVPLQDGAYGLGVVARMDGKGAVLGYFFGERHEQLPQLSDISELSAADNVLIKIFGDLGLENQTWPVIGPLPQWRRENWPMPAFVRHASLTATYFSVEYEDDDPNSHPQEREISREEYEYLPENGLAGSGFVEQRLTRLLRG